MQEDLKTFIILFKSYQSLLNQVKQSLEGTDFTLNEFMAMEALLAKGSLTTQELIDSVLIANSSMTYVLDTLARKGWIERIRDEDDRRIQKISLTVSGRAHIQAVYQEHYPHMRSFFEILSTQEEAQLQTLLKRIGYAAAGKKGKIK